MGLGNCPECGRLYMDGGVGMCQDCYRLEEDNELKIAEFLRDVDKATVQEIHNATGVKEKTIVRMIKKGRLLSNTKIFYGCEMCGAPIEEGRLCGKCESSFLQQVKESADSARKNDQNRDGIRIYSKDKER